MSNQIVSSEDLLVSNMLEIQAIIRILKQKGITTEDDILREVQKLKVEMDEQCNPSKPTGPKPL